MAQTANGPLSVDTSVAKRRPALRFARGEEVVAEAERIGAAEREGRLLTTGNWTAGQSFGHLAAFINYAYDGFPGTPPWIVRAVMKRRKARFLSGPMRAGIRIPRVNGGTWGIEPMATEAGLKKLREAWRRLSASPPPLPNPLFGPLTHEEWMALHLRHAELHLSFLDPIGAGKSEFGSEERGSTVRT